MTDKPAAPSEFNFEREVAQLEKLTEDVRGAISGGAKDLGDAFDFSIRCDQMAERANALIRRARPPEPSPPKTDQMVQVSDVELRRLPYHLRLFSRRQPHPVDVNNMVPVFRKVGRKAMLDDPRFPGSPEIRVPVELEVREVRQLPLKPRGAAEEPAEPMPLGTFLQPRSFRYVLVNVKTEMMITVDAVPPDKPLTPMQQAYQDRLEALEKEVYDLHSFIAARGREVDEIESKSRELQQKADRLKLDIEGLPNLDSTLGQLRDTSTQMKELSEELSKEEAFLADQKKQFEETKAKIDELIT